MNPSPPELFPQRPIRSDFGRAPSYRTRRVITILVILLLVGFIFHWVFGGPSLLHPGEIPTIKAEGAWKQRPEQPGGIDIPHQDVQVYQALDGKEAAKPQVEHLLPPPEVPQSSLPANNTNTNAAPAPAAPQTENLVPPQTAAKPEAPAPAPAPAAAPVVATTVAPQPAQTPTPSLVQPVKPIAATPVAPLVKKKPATLSQVVKDTMASGKTAHIVQLASVQSESSAQDMMDKLQSRYASVLGDAQLRLVRADLGARGVYYRIQSEPLADEQANKICAALKKMNAGCLLVH